MKTFREELWHNLCFNFTILPTIYLDVSHEIQKHGQSKYRVPRRVSTSRLGDANYRDWLFRKSLPLGRNGRSVPIEETERERCGSPSPIKSHFQTRTVNRGETCRFRNISPSITSESSRWQCRLIINLTAVCNNPCLPRARGYQFNATSIRKLTNRARCVSTQRNRRVHVLRRDWKTQCSMNIILGASTGPGVRSVDGVSSYVPWSIGIRSRIGSRRPDQSERRRKEDGKEEGRQTDRFLQIGDADRVGIEETDNLSLFDKLWVPPPPPLPAAFIVSVYRELLSSRSVIWSTCMRDPDSSYRECQMSNLRRNEFH